MPEPDSHIFETDHFLIGCNGFSLTSSFAQGLSSMNFEATVSAKIGEFHGSINALWRLLNNSLVHSVTFPEAFKFEVNVLGEWTDDLEKLANQVITYNNIYTLAIRDVDRFTREYSVTSPISKCSRKMFWLPIDTDNNKIKQMMDKIGWVGTLLLICISNKMSYLGIRRATLEPNVLTLCRTPAFTWDRVDDLVISDLKAVVGGNMTITKVP